MTENPTDRPEAVEPQGDLHAAFVAALQGQPAHQDGAGIVRRVAPWAAHEMADRCVDVVREHDAPEHHPDLIALHGGGEREALDQERDDRRAWMRAALDLQAVARRERARADAAEAALAARPAPESTEDPCATCGKPRREHRSGYSAYRCTFAARPAPVASGADVDLIERLLRYAEAQWSLLDASTIPAAESLNESRVRHVATVLAAALGLTVADEGTEPPFWRDLATGEPCPRSGPVLCTITSPDHLHRAIHMDAPVADEGRAEA